MPKSDEPVPDRYRVLIADDEPDVHAVTRLSIKALRRGDRRIELLSAMSGTDAVEMMRANPDIAVILLDVVMETDTAGLDACRAIREELGNRFVRILLRTGQPGIAPERKAIDDYDIDDYLPKAELSANRLYTSVRTALKSHDELIELDRTRRSLAQIHDCVVSLHSFEPLEVTLERVLTTVVALCPSPLAVLHLETFEEHGNPRRFLLHHAPGTEALRSEAAAEAVQRKVAHAAAGSQSRTGGMTFEAGFLVPVALHRDLGQGWIYVERVNPDELVRKALAILAAHAANALYSSVAEAMLRARQGPVFDVLAI